MIILCFCGDYVGLFVNAGQRMSLLTSTAISTLQIWRWLPYRFQFQQSNHSYVFLHHFAFNSKELELGLVSNRTHMGISIVSRSDITLVRGRCSFRNQLSDGQLSAVEHDVAHCRDIHCTIA